jgi:hypothetical protein
MCRKLNYSFFVLALVLVLISDASAGLVGHWKLDESSGTTAVDATGNGHDGELIGNPEWVTGYFGGALKLAGSPDKVDVPYSAELNPEEEFTASVWANLDPAGSDYRSPITSRDEGPQRGYIIYCTPENTWQFWTGPGWYSVGSPPVTLGEWTHVAGTYSSGEKKLYVNGELAAENFNTMSPNTARVLRIGAGATEGNGAYFFVGMIDDVRVYDRTLTAGQVQGLTNGVAPIFAKAEKPDPEDGAMHPDMWVTLGWSPGDFAVSHNVYLGDNFDDVNDGTTDSPVFRGNQDRDTTTFIAGFFGFPYPDGLVPGTTYYWRIDEVNDANPDSPWKGDVWSFWIPPNTAYNPDPADGDKFVSTDVTLSWTQGFSGGLHIVYFGDNFDDVNSATAGSPQAVTTYTPGTLELDKTYYWRVDEFAPPVTHRGDVWSFTTLPVISITNPDLLGHWTLDEGAGTTAVDWSGHGGHGSFVGEPQWVDGYQGMALQFSGSGQYVNCGDDTGAGVTADFTLAAWAQMAPDNASQYMGIGGKLLNSGGYRGFSLVRHNSNVFRLWVGDGTDDLAKSAVSSDVTYTDADWHHVAGVREGQINALYVDGVRQAATTATGLVPSEQFFHIGRQYSHLNDRYFEGKIDDVQLYNKAFTAEQIASLMLGDTKLAGNPVPDRDAIVDILNASSLSWSAGDTAASHDVYLGTDRDAVAGAAGNSPDFQGNQAGTGLSLAGLVEFGGGDYYWRIDEVEADGTVIAGTIWKFTVPDYLIVDDFESYNDIPEGEPGSKLIYLTWKDGFDNPATNGSTTGYPTGASMETGTVHGGLQSMPYSYDNNFKSSQATLTLTSLRDWTQAGVTKLSLWFHGDPANAPEQMNVALNGAAPVYHDDSSAATIDDWTQWTIDLSTFGVTLTDVSSVTIGFGVPGSTAAGGTGDMLFDDLLLTR